MKKKPLSEETKEKISESALETRRMNREIVFMRHKTEMARMNRELADIQEQGQPEGLTIEDIEELFEEKFSEQDDDGEINIAQLVQLLGKGGGLMPSGNTQQTQPYYETPPSLPLETPLNPVSQEKVLIVANNLEPDLKQAIQSMPKEEVVSIMGGVWEHLNTLKA